MEDYKGYPDVSKGGGGGRRFAIIMLFVLMGLILIGGMVTTEPTVSTEIVTTATPTAVPSGVNVQTAVDSSPSVNVAIEQAPPPPAVQDNTAALMANDTARDARLVADSALAQAITLHGRVDSLHGRVAELEAVDIAPTLVAFDSRAAGLESQLATITAATIGSLFGLLLMAIAGGLLLLRTPPPPPRLTIDHNQPQRVSFQSEPVAPLTVPRVTPPRTVLEPCRNGATEPAEPLTVLDPSRPPSAGERAYLRYLHNLHNGSISATCRQAYGYKNAKLFDWVKDAVIG